MSQPNERLRNLVAAESDGCCDADVLERVDQLQDVKRGAGLDRADDDLRALTSLASETRYRIVRLLGAADGELCVCEIEPLLDVSSSAVSHALSDLTDAGLVTRRKKGRWRYYRSTERADALLEALDETGSAGR